MADGPVWYWRLGEEATTAAARSAPLRRLYMNGVTLGRPGAITGDPSSEAGLDGIDDTVSVPSSAALGPTAGISLEAWVRPGASTGHHDDPRKDGQYLLRLTPSGNLVFRLWNGSQTTELTTAPNIVQPGRYQHVVATWNGAEMALYVNATPARDHPVNGPIMQRHVEPLRRRQLGRLRLAEGRFRRGGGIYGKALKARRVAAHFAAAVCLTVLSLCRSTRRPTAAPSTTPGVRRPRATEPGNADTVTGQRLPRRTASGTPAQVVTAEVQPAARSLSRAHRPWRAARTPRRPSRPAPGHAARPQSGPHLHRGRPAAANHARGG